MSTDAKQLVESLACWQGTVDAHPLDGGITNVNFTVEDNGEKFVVRLGGDIPVHHVMRFNELAASRAGFAAGTSPEIVHAEPGVLVLRFIEGHVFGEEDVRDPAKLEQVVELVKRFHEEAPKHLRGPALIFWVFHLVREYIHVLREGNSRHTGKLQGFAKIADRLERIVGPIDLVFAHNDLLAANIIDDGAKLWLIDFDYAGFNSPLFDLANLASNNQLSEDQERWLLDTYFGCPPSDGLWRAYSAMKCASLLRETMWSMVSEIHSKLDFDFNTYTAENLARFERAYATFSTEVDI